MLQKCATCAARYLGVEVAARLRLRTSKQRDAVVVLLASRPAAFSQVLSVLQGQQMVTHPTFSKCTSYFCSVWISLLVSAPLAFELLWF